MKGVSAMTASAMNTSALTKSGTTSTAHRPAADALVEKVALRLLAWSERRATKNQLMHERMALLLENQRNSTRGGSSLGR